MEWVKEKNGILIKEDLILKEHNFINEEENKKEMDIKDKYENEDKNYDYKDNIHNKGIKTDYKNEINLVYYAESKDFYYIFGEDFVKTNKKNINLIINGKKDELHCDVELEEGDNNITLIIKNKLTNFDYFFYGCRTLKDITEMKYFDVSEIKSFECMFGGCEMLFDIKVWENLNVSNSNNFLSMLSECTSLTDLKPL